MGQMRHPNYYRLTQSELDALENLPISVRQFWERYGHPLGVTPESGEACRANQVCPGLEPESGAAT